MAAPKNTKAPAEPVNSEQLEASLAAQEPGPTPPPQGAPTGPTEGELEERTVVAEERAEAAERKVAGLEEEMRILRDQMALLMRQARSPQERPDRAEAGQGVPPAGVPVFEEDRPHGIIYGDAEVAYEQDGHQYGRDRSYVRTLKHHGAGRPFNPRLVGAVKPRPGQQLADVLDGFRDK